MGKDKKIFGEIPDQVFTSFYYICVVIILLQLENNSSQLQHNEYSSQPQIMDFYVEKNLGEHFSVVTPL